jgi:hypothetical protein
MKYRTKKIITRFVVVGFIIITVLSYKLYKSIEEVEELQTRLTALEQLIYDE